MDLFGDLPEPSKVGGKQEGLSLYDDVPDQSTGIISKNTSVTMETGKRKIETNGNKSDHSVKKQKSAKYKLTSYLAERQGEREDMQDAHLIVQDFTGHFQNLDPSIYRMAVYGVFDGHGGARASRFASENLHKNLCNKFPNGDISQVEKEIRKAFIDAFKKTDDEFLKEAARHKPVWKDGSTAILVLVLNEILYIANIGDSQAVLCRYKEETKTYVPIPLSVPHNPSMYEERMRIQKQGGHVKDGRVMGVLEVSRSFGDGQYKKLGVTCVPDIKKCQLTDKDRFVIIACDGLWKCFEPEDGIQFVNKILQDDTIKDSDTRTAEEVRFETACNKLANEAVLRLSGDNTTVLLLQISKTS